MRKYKERKKNHANTKAQICSEEKEDQVADPARRIMTPQWAFVVLSIFVSISASGLWYFLSQRDPHKALWIGLFGYFLLGLLVVLYLRNGIIENEEAVRLAASQPTTREPTTQEIPSPSKRELPEKQPAPPTEQKRTGRGGLTFREVSPEEIGVPIPDTFMVDFGTNIGSFSRTLLERQVPFEKLTGIKFPGEIPLRLFFDENRELKIDTTVYEKDGSVGAVIKANDFAVLSASWDRNWDRVAFEIVDESLIPIFQIQRPRENLIRLRGVFRTSAGHLIVATDSRITYNPTVPVFAPTRLFAYPSATNLHRRLRTAQ